VGALQSERDSIWMLAQGGGEGDGMSEVEPGFVLLTL